MASRGSQPCQEAFSFLRERLKAHQNVEESVEYEPLKENDCPSYNVNNTPRVRFFFGEKLEVFMYIPEKSVPAIKSDGSVSEALRAWVDRAQLGGMSRLLRVQLGSRSDAEVLLPLIEANLKQ